MYAQAQWYVRIRCGQTKLEIILKARNRRRRRGGVYVMILRGGGERSSCMMVKKANQAHERDRGQAEYGVWLKSQSNTASQSTYAFSCMSLHQA